MVQRIPAFVKLVLPNWLAFASAQTGRLPQDPVHFAQIDDYSRIYRLISSDLARDGPLQ
jgi:hypothetical protein